MCARRMCPQAQPAAGKAGKVLIPYRGVNQAGVRVALSCWDTLLPGEDLAMAAHRLSAQAQDTD